MIYGINQEDLIPGCEIIAPIDYLFIGFVKPTRIPTTPPKIIKSEIGGLRTILFDGMSGREITGRLVKSDSIKTQDSDDGWYDAVRERILSMG